MARKTTYITNQKTEVLDYIRKQADTHLTAKGIYAGLQKKNMRIGLTTVYRHLERLCEEGILIRHYIDENTPVCYEYTGHAGTESCWHCKCTECGRLIHLHCDEIEHLRKHILQDHDFLFQENHTVFFGICGDCRRKAAYVQEQ